MFNGRFTMGEVDGYTFKPFSRQRQNISLVAAEGWRKHSIHAMVELDVTDARKLIRKYRDKIGKKISFTGWLIKCVAQAVSEHKELNSFRQGRRKIVVFDDVDIGIPVERFIEGEYRPMGHVIRKANEKTVEEISEEIRSLQQEEVDASREVLGQKLSFFERFILNAPLFVKRFLLSLVRNNGIFKKKHLGTVGLTSVGSAAGIDSWVLPLGGVSTTLIAVGGIKKKPAVVDDKVKVREYLHVVVTVDHDLVDGAPLARFVSRFNDLVESGYGLDRLEM